MRFDSSMLACLLVSLSMSCVGNHSVEVSIGETSQSFISIRSSGSHKLSVTSSVLGVRDCAVDLSSGAEHLMIVLCMLTSCGFQ